MSKIKIEIGFGMEFAGDGHRLDFRDRELGIHVIRARAVELFGACTIITTLGDWLDPDTSKTVSESGRTLIILADLPPVLLTERVNALIANIKEALSQKAVAVTHYQVDFEIV